MNEKKTQIDILLQINPNSGLPIYRQIIDQISRLIAGGYLKPDDELPSIREIASTYDINQMTVSKAYSFLETKGILEHKRGKRMVVAEHVDSNEQIEDRIKYVKPIIDDLKRQSRQLKIPLSVIIEQISDGFEEDI